MSIRRAVKARGRTRVRPAERAPLGEATRERLIEAGRRLFGERGFHHVTVRDLISEANVNLAAVGYHFGDKLGLYRTVIDAEIAELRRLNEGVVVQGDTPEEKLRSYVHNYLPRMVKPDGHVEWAQRLFRHEMAQPTPLAQEIAEKLFRPRMRYLAELVAEALGCAVTDRRVLFTAFSIQAQCMFYVRDSFRTLVFANWPAQTPQEIRAAADHIAEFSIAGIRALASR